MRSFSGSDLARQAQHSLLGYLVPCIAAVFLTPCMFAASPAGPESSPTTEAANKDVAATRDTKKIDKYDVEHIGQRGIGRGFNLYSLKREHALGQSMAVSFDRMTRRDTDPI